MTDVAVVGASGYVGGRLVEHLSKAGCSVRAIVGRTRSWVDAPQTALDLVTCTTAELANALAGAEVVVHLAGRSEVEAAADPERALVDTVLASQRVGGAASAVGVRRMVYLSTIHVYGDRMLPGEALTEDLRPEPRHPYAIARLASEHVLAAIASQSGWESIVLRLTNAVGAPAHPDVDRWSLVANDLCRQAVTTGRMRLDTSGMQWRDFIPLTDACTAIAAACASNVPPGTYNLGSGRPTRVIDLARIVQASVERLIGAAPSLGAPASDGNDPQPYRVATDGLAVHGISSTTPLDDAVDETVRFCAERMVHQ